MTKKTIAPIVLALVLGALPANAGRRSDEDDGTRRRGHEAHRSHEHDAYRSHHERQEAKIAVLAEHLDHATSDLVHEAVSRTRHRSWREWRALQALRRLERRADRYHARVERHGASSRRAEATFDDLERAYHAVAACRDDLRRSRRVRHEFERVDELMDKLDRRIAKLDRDEERRTGSRDSKTHVAFHFGF
jgi:hypothetical protein